jgi:5,10-methylenetetrahydromethanopterin reductase
MGGSQGCGGAANVGIRVPPCAPLSETVACLARAEAAGFGTAWVPDSEFLFRDPWMVLGGAAAATGHLRLATGVTNLQTRHPAVTANALNTLEEAAPGRAVLGLGSGDTAVKALGLRPSRLAELEAALSDIRTLCAGGRVDYRGRPMHLNGATGRVPPLFVAASGPRTLELAGRVADGVLIMAGVAPGLVRDALARVDRGLASAGRDRSDIEICLGAVCHVAEDHRDVVRIAKPHGVGDAQRGQTDTLGAAGVALEGPVPERIPDVYPDLTHAEDWDRAVEVAGRWMTDDAARRYAELFSFIGTPEDLIGRFGAARQAGVDSFYLRHYRSYVLPDDLIDRFAGQVLPHLTAGP